MCKNKEEPEEPKTDKVAAPLASPSKPSSDDEPDQVVTMVEQPMMPSVLAPVQGKGRKGSKSKGKGRKGKNKRLQPEHGNDMKRAKTAAVSTEGTLASASAGDEGTTMDVDHETPASVAGKSRAR
eukprot:1422664-Amphidinium_carterae.1